ncbi:hypothetical protein BPY_22790 [Bifidobacterium psychraerophilum]|uniref:hypothetical protein n=1 Tax=Bifidobacterium psychraerophilum TaxID=218140 RepID=UPI0031115D4E
MSISITKPTKTVEIVTDLAALRESLLTAQALDAANKDQQPRNKTAAEKHRRSIQAQKGKLKELVSKVDASTLNLTLRGLISSKWNMITVKNSHVDGERIIKDWPVMIAEALPDMLESAQWKTSGEQVDFNDADLKEFIESLSDTQVQDLMVNIQELNSPVVTVPKDLKALL